jgi:hypothetical protein
MVEKIPSATLMTMLFIPKLKVKINWIKYWAMKNRKNMAEKIRPKPA